MRHTLMIGLMAAGLPLGSLSAQTNPPLQEMQPPQDSLLPPSLRNLAPLPPTAQPPAQPAPQSDAAPAAAPDQQGVPPPDMTPQVQWPNKWLPAQTARLQLLDKVNATTQLLVVKVGQTATFESLTIAVKACVVRPPDQPLDAAAFLEVTDNHPDMPGFTGWIASGATKLDSTRVRIL